MNSTVPGAPRQSLRARRLRVWALVFAALIAANGAIVLTESTYIYKAVLHLNPNINDLEVFPSAVVAAGPAEPWPFAEDYGRRDLPPDLFDLLVRRNTVAFLVVKGGALSYERYWHGYSESSLVNSFSVAKSIVASLVGIALDEGLIKNLDQPVGDFLPEFRVGPKAAIRVRHLLTMSSGMAFAESYAQPFNVTTDAYYGSNLRRLATSLPVASEPGTVSSYASGDTLVLGLLLEAATSMGLSEYASERLWSRIGAERDARWSLDRAGGDEKAFCCFYATARDFARLGELYRHAGAWGGKRIISSAYVERALTPHGIPDRRGEPTNHYGFQWWILEHQGMKVYYASGILGQLVAVIPARGLVVVRLGKEKSHERLGYYWKDYLHIFDGVLAMYPHGRED